jgi:hypothetical protein
MTDDRKERLMQGKTCLANKRILKGKCKDEELIKWAKETGRYLYIGKGSGYAKEGTSDWFNKPLADNKKKGIKTTNEEAVVLFREYILQEPKLLKRIPELKGKLLVCWCYPKACHGNVLIELLEKGLLV